MSLSPPATRSIPPPLMAPLLAPTDDPADLVERDNADLTRAIFHETKENRPENTSLAYDPKIKEFYGYCDAIYGTHNTSIRYLVTPTKVYNFLFYQAHREKRKPGKKGPQGFSLDEYKEIVARYAGKASSEWVPPTNPVQFQQINTYKSSLIELHKEQVANRANTYIWGHHIWTTHCQRLYELVKSRRNRMKKANYVEKVDETLSFFKAYGKSNQIENALWLKASNCRLRATFPALR